MGNIKIEIPDHVTEIIDRIENAGFEAYLAGGCVRDSLLGIIPKDYDVATNAEPDRVVEIFEDMRVVKTGISHGTVTVVSGSGHVEVTTYRTESGYTDKRRPDKVLFISSIEDDLARRDFTVNAMAYSPDKGLKDPFDGRKDLQKGLIRSVGDPGKRFGEDYLRIIRAARFVSSLGFDIETKTLDAMRIRKEKLGEVAIERIQTEFSLLLCGGHVYKALMECRGFVEVFMPEIKSMGEVCPDGKKLYEKTARAVSKTPDSIRLRLAAFLRYIRTPYISKQKGENTKDKSTIAAGILKRLRFDKETTKKTSVIISEMETSLVTEERFIKKFLSRHSYEILEDLIEVKKAYTPEKAEQLEEVRNRAKEIISSGECIFLNDLAVSGQDLIEMGFKPGKKIGEILEDCLSKVIENEIENSCDNLKKYVKIKYRCNKTNSKEK